MRPLLRRSACVTLARTARCAAARHAVLLRMAAVRAAGSPARRRAAPIRVARHAYTSLGVARASAQPRHRRSLPPTGAGRAHVMKCTSSRSIARGVRAAHHAAHAESAALRKFRSRPCLSRCHTGDMEITLHSPARRSPMQTFKTAE